MENYFYPKLSVSQETAYCQQIASQAMKITLLENKISQYRENTKQVLMLIGGIGGPLNDNKLKFSRDQMKLFLKIEEIINEEEN